MKTLETARLILRPFQERDAADFFAYASLPDVGPNAGWKPHESIGESRKILREFIEEDEVWALEDKISRRVIGSLGLHWEVNREIAALCRARGILVNAVDDKDACTFLFPALARRGELTVGVSTAGASPSAAAWVRERVEDLLPEDFGELLEYLSSLRPLVRERVPAERRAGVFSRLFALCLEGGFPLEAEALEEVLGD